MFQWLHLCCPWSRIALMKALGGITAWCHNSSVSEKYYKLILFWKLKQEPVNFTECTLTPLFPLSSDFGSQSAHSGASWACCLCCCSPELYNSHQTTWSYTRPKHTTEEELDWSVLQQVWRVFSATGEQYDFFFTVKNIKFYEKVWML